MNWRLKSPIVLVVVLVQLSVPEIPAGVEHELNVNQDSQQSKTEDENDDDEND